MSILLAPLLLLSSVSQEDPARQPAPATVMVEPAAMMIAAFDTNADARVTADELAAGVGRSFESVDTATSGTIGYIDFADWAERWLGDRTALPSPFEVDRDGDNRITLAELQASFQGLFARLDKDGDRVLVRAELLTLRSPAAHAGRRDRSPER